jgi:hypothetical protein
MSTIPVTAVQQRGAATLIVAIILLLALTLATFSAARIGISEQRSVANDIRAKEAFWVAQAGIEQGIAFINANKALISSGSGPAAGPPPVEQGWQMAGNTRWVSCGSGGTTPCGDGTTAHGNRWMRYDKAAFPINNLFQQVSPSYTFDLDFLAWSGRPLEGAGSFPRINTRVVITSTVTTPAGGDPLRDLTAANAVRVSQMVSGYDTLVGPPDNSNSSPPFIGAPYIDAPLVVAGTVELNANVSIWGNPSSPPLTPIYHNQVFDANPTNPDPLGAYGATINSNEPAVPETITINSRLPLSIWSKDSTSLLGQAQTCVPVSKLLDVQHPDYSKPSNYAASPRLSGSAAGYCTGAAAVMAGGNDIIDCVPYPPVFSIDPGCAGMRAAWDANIANATAPPFFPPDLFYYVFGVGNGSFQRVRNDATVLADCSTLWNQPSGLYWVDGSCTIPVNTNIGGTAAIPTAPITLVVNGGTFTLGAGVNFWGTVFLRGGPPNAQLVLPIVVPRPVLHGALIADQNLTVTGQLDLVYDPRAFMTSSARAGGFAKVLGGWMDSSQ